LQKENRRKFLLELAAEKGIDPYQAENWETVTRADVQAKKVICVAQICHCF